MWAAIDRWSEWGIGVLFAPFFVMRNELVTIWKVWLTSTVLLLLLLLLLL